MEANNDLVGQVPMELSCLDTFLRAYDDDNEVSVKVTGSRMLERLLRMGSLSQEHSKAKRRAELLP